MNISVLEKLNQSQRRYMGRLEFFKESIRNIKSVGTVTRSSRFLCKSTVNAAELQNAKVVIELGAGDGVMTNHILEDLPADARLYAFEINEVFYKQLAEIKDHRLTISSQSAELLSDYISKEIGAQPDVIISALPFSVFPEDLAASIVQQCYDNLKIGGRFVQIHYSLKTRKLYNAIFGNLTTKWEPLNIPPAFVMKAIKH